MEDAGMKVLRVWLDGQSTATTKACTPIGGGVYSQTLMSQGTTITAYPDLEPNEIGVFDDTVLELLDDFMPASRDHGVKVGRRIWQSLRH